jgi:hypothetical protein
VRILSSPCGDGSRAELMKLQDKFWKLCVLILLLMPYCALRAEISQLVQDHQSQQQFLQ